MLSSKPIAITIESNNLTIAVIFCFLFLINPLFSLCLLLLFIMRSTRFNYFALLLLTFQLTAYLSLINTTKIPDSDLEVYLMWRDAASHLNFFQYMTQINREPLYFALDYILFFLFNGESKPFVFFITFIMYMFLLLSVIKIGKVIKLDQPQVILLIVFIGLFPQLFSFSAHAIRQCLAGSLLLYFLARRIENSNPSNWIYYCASVLFHTSVFIFFFLLALSNKNIKLFFSWNSIKSFIILTVFLFFLMSIFGADYLSDTTKKMSSARFYDMGDFNVKQIFLSCFIVVVSGYYLWFCRLPASVAVAREGLGVALFLSLGVLVMHFSMAESSLSTRYFIYSYFLMLFPLSVLISRIKLYKTIYYLLILIIIALFYNSIDTSMWEYAPVTSLIICPVFCYF